MNSFHELDELLDELELKTYDFSNNHLNININTFKLTNEQRRSSKIDFNNFALTIETALAMSDDNIITKNQQQLLKYRGVNFLSSGDDQDYMVLALDIDEFDGDELDLSSLSNLVKLLHPHAKYSIAEGLKNNTNGYEHKSYLISVYNLIGKVKDFNDLFKFYLHQLLDKFKIQLTFKIDASIYTPNHLIRLPYSIVDTKPEYKHVKTGSIYDFDFTNTHDKYMFDLQRFIIDNGLHEIQKSNITSTFIDDSTAEINTYKPLLQKYEEMYKLRGPIISIKDLFTVTNIYHGFIYALSPLPPLLRLFTKFFNRYKENGVLIHNDNGNNQVQETDVTSNGVIYPRLNLFKVMTALNTLVQMYNDSTTFLTFSTKSSNNKLLDDCYKALYNACTDKAKENFDIRRKRYSTNITTGNVSLLMNAVTILDIELFNSYLSRLKYFSSMNVKEKYLDAIKDCDVNDIIEEWSNPERRYDKFETSNYTITNYLSEMNTYEYLARHLYSLSYCIAYITNLRKYAVKMPPTSDNDGQDNRWVYRLMTLDEIEKEFKNIIKVNYTKEELEQIIDSDENNNKLQPWYSRNYQTTIAKILASCEAQVMSFFAVYSNIDKFGFKTTEFSTKTPLYYNDFSNNDKDDEIYALCKEFVETNVTREYTGLTTRHLCLYVAPLNVGYKQALAKIWFTTMLTCIDPLYHNAFYDFIYAIRYRLLSSKKQIPQKFYINYGKGGDGKSFMCESIRNIFGSFAQGTNSKQTADQFNKWEFDKGFIYIEEAENMNDKEFRTYVKTITTEEASSRGMNELLEMKHRLAIRAMNTNSPTLCELIYGEKAVIERMVIIKFNEENNISTKSWNALHNLFKFSSFDENTSTINGPYSLFRYIVDDEGFVSNEGKDYKKFNLSRYDGEEKITFIQNAKTFKYKVLDDEMNNIINNVNSQVMKYSTKSNYNYIDQQHLKSYLKEKTNLKYTDNELNLWFAKHNDWHYSKRIYDDDGFVITGYRRDVKTSLVINEDSELMRELIESSSVPDNQVINKNTITKDHIKEQIKTFITNNVKTHTIKNNSFNYISVSELNAFVKEIDTLNLFSSLDVKTTASEMGFEQKSISVKNQKFLAYRKSK